MVVWMKLTIQRKLKKTQNQKNHIWTENGEKIPILPVTHVNNVFYSIFSIVEMHKKEQNYNLNRCCAPLMRRLPQWSCSTNFTRPTPSMGQPMNTRELQKKKFVLREWSKLIANFRNFGLSDISTKEQKKFVKFSSESMNRSIESFMRERKLAVKEQLGFG